MPLAVMLSDEPSAADLPLWNRRRPHPRCPTTAAAAFTGDSVGPDSWMLFVPEEPTLGMRFHYADLTWEVVDYSDGWVARMVVAQNDPGSRSL